MSATHRQLGPSAMAPHSSGRIRHGTAGDTTVATRAVAAHLPALLGLETLPPWRASWPTGPTRRRDRQNGEFLSHFCARLSVWAQRGRLDHGAAAGQRA